MGIFGHFCCFDLGRFKIEGVFEGLYTLFGVVTDVGLCGGTEADGGIYTFLFVGNSGLEICK